MTVSSENMSTVFDRVDEVGFVDGDGVPVVVRGEDRDRAGEVVDPDLGHAVVRGGGNAVRRVPGAVELYVPAGVGPRFGHGRQQRCVRVGPMVMELGRREAGLRGLTGAMPGSTLNLGPNRALDLTAVPAPG